MSYSSQPSPITDAQPPENEQRASVRFLCNLDASCQSTGPGKQERWSASVRDISHAGIGLVMDQHFAPGTVIGVEVPSPDEDLAYTMFARVMHATRLPDGNWQIGCLFVRTFSDEELKALL